MPFYCDTVFISASLLEHYDFLLESLDLFPIGFYFIRQLGILLLLQLVLAGELGEGLLLLGEKLLLLGEGLVFQCDFMRELGKGLVFQRDFMRQLRKSHLVDGFYFFLDSHRYRSFRSRVCIVQLLEIAVIGLMIQMPVCGIILCQLLNEIHILFVQCIGHAGQIQEVLRRELSCDDDIHRES